MRVVSLFKHVINITPCVYAKFNKRGVLWSASMMKNVMCKKIHCGKWEETFEWLPYQLEEIIIIQVLILVYLNRDKFLHFYISPFWYYNSNCVQFKFPFRSIKNIDGHSVTPLGYNIIQYVLYTGILTSYYPFYRALCNKWIICLDDCMRQQIMYNNY